MLYSSMQNGKLGKTGVYSSQGQTFIILMGCREAERWTFQKIFSNKDAFLKQVRRNVSE